MRSNMTQTTFSKYEIDTHFGKQYKMANDTAYPVNTPDKLIDVLEKCRLGRIRVVFDFGNTETGESWGERYDISGYIGRTTGVKSPILVHNSRSTGGGMIFLDSVLSIRTSKGKVLLYSVSSLL